ncbi:PREDICTED: uncharacterized protein LOC104600473 isoform X2 [Nelumbo nucifera]|uniref:Embryogenesis-associated protein EMB8 n=2 Tax=Nelumbo nucifera TaxID=4432 RepID=A0A822ZHS5_NELNU|nr:PREDICTED: uncharacterized protein LOC104600473 isoform X2 [Nelumbo nucifera]DAD44173.1 TPA_asm: hypothetical protein HUJ06_002403 [Nelumbo nucifera]
MSSKLNYVDLNLRPSCFLPVNNLTYRRPNLQFRGSCVWRRRKLKSPPKFTLSNRLGPSIFSALDDLSQALLSLFPSVNSLDLIAPALGFASGLALYFFHLKSSRDFAVSHIGSWILFTSPTPFNRFVLLRCPSLSFQGSELLQDVNENLVKEDRHFVKLNSGRIQIKEPAGVFEGKLLYQRVCVPTDDGGVISLDWPANLDLTEEPGMDTTLLLVPGTTEGSMDNNIRMFVYESLKHGCFPIVMNPRGCAGSPLTTARLFTAADSDDICTAVQFINRARPRTTLMGVGWGYGANMLTKYLAEVGERTPFTAATCFDNPFDLEEATRSSSHHIAADQKLTDGLIDILRSNKELFYGRAKGFNVEKALSAKSLRDFESAISIVSYGFESTEEFYAKASTRQLVGNVKVPLLFIQSDNGTVPVFSTPRNSIAENPFTSLLLCSCLPSSMLIRSWYHQLAIEWLTAVELGLLKGRHPLLKDLDVTINPPKGALNGYSVDPIRDMLEESDTAANFHLRSRRYLEKELNFGGLRWQEENNRDVSQQNTSVDVQPVKEEGDNPVNTERGQVLQTAQMVMNMLDVTMPGTLADEQKKKVLSAVEQGETLMKALQGAVPEYVRGKLTAAVSEIVQTQGTKKIGEIHNVPSKGNSRVQETLGGLSNSEVVSNDTHPSKQAKGVDDPPGDSVNNQPDMEKTGGELEPELQPTQNLQKSVDPGYSQSGSNHAGDISSPERKDGNKLENNHVKSDILKKKAAQFSDFEETGERGVNLNHHNGSKMAGGTEEGICEQDGMSQGSGIAHMKVEEVNDTQNNEDKKRILSSIGIEESLSNSKPFPESPSMEKKGNGNEKNEDNDMQPATNHSKRGSIKSEETSPSLPPTSNTPSISVSQALDALTGFDDSTQMAVNSVFGVLENMITQLEEDKHDKNDENEDKNEDGKPGSTSEIHSSNANKYKLEAEEECKIELSSQSDLSCIHPVSNFHENCAESHQEGSKGWNENKLTQNPISSFNNTIADSNRINHVYKEDKREKHHFSGPKYLVYNSDKVRHVCNIPLYVTVDPYGDSMYNEYLRKYLLSRIPTTKSLDLDTTTDLLLDYFPEEGQYKLLDQSENNRSYADDGTTDVGLDGNSQAILSPDQANDTDTFIEPSYVILETKKEQEPVGEYETINTCNKKDELIPSKSLDLVQLIKNIILDSLKVEVGRRLGSPDMEAMESNLAQDLEKVADTVSLAVEHSKEVNLCLENKDTASGKVGTLDAEHVIRAISYAVQDASYLRKVLPVGVIVGSSLAALRKYFNVATLHDNDHSEAENVREKFYDKMVDVRDNHKYFDKKNQYFDIDSSVSSGKEKGDVENDDRVMVGAVTAALGASALLVHQQIKEPYKSGNISEVSSRFPNEKENHEAECGKFEETVPEKSQSNIVSSLAEKAMSVAAPVVPTKSDGEVDQERLVAMLADLGQKGGILKLLGKIALLWGGIRGAMSLTDRLISFLHIADRPLFQRILGFICMVLVLWSPVVIPLFPTLVQSWAAQNSTGIAKYACILGLYTAVMILITLWGKRIRGYENPLKQYGLDLTSSQKLNDFLMGLIGGAILISLMHYINTLLGCACLSWPLGLTPASPDAMSWIKVYARMIIQACRGIVTAIGIAITEELLFRSWLPEEITVDLGYHRAIIISGFAFSILQRSPRAIPGLWLLSLALSGIRQRNDGSLSIPIGIRAGMLASNFILQTGGFLAYNSNSPLWLTGSYPYQPFSGAVGLVLSLLLALTFYPRQPLREKKISGAIQE